MPLRKCVKSHYHRDYLLWMRYLDELWDQPSRTDNYLMQIALEVKRVLMKRPEKVKLSDFLLKFTNKRKPLGKTAKKQADQTTKSKWLGLVGLGKKKK